jgi:hypothetical protein
MTDKRFSGGSVSDGRRAGGGLTLLVYTAHPVPQAEHVALLRDPRRFDLLRRKRDLLDEGVAAVFGLAQGEAELLALCFDAGLFTPAEVAQWLVERGFTALRLVLHAGGEGRP